MTKWSFVLAQVILVHCTGIVHPFIAHLYCSYFLFAISFSLRVDCSHTCLFAMALLLGPGQGVCHVWLELTPQTVTDSCVTPPLCVSSIPFFTPPSTLVIFRHRSRRIFPPSRSPAHSRGCRFPGNHVRVDSGTADGLPFIRLHNWPIKERQPVALMTGPANPHTPHP